MCRTPLGWPVDPEVYSKKRGSSLSIHSTCTTQEDQMVTLPVGICVWRERGAICPSTPSVHVSSCLCTARFSAIAASTRWHQLENTHCPALAPPLLKSVSRAVTELVQPCNPSCEICQPKDCAPGASAHPAQTHSFPPLPRPERPETTDGNLLLASWLSWANEMSEVTRNKGNRK